MEYREKGGVLTNTCCDIERLTYRLTERLYKRGRLLLTITAGFIEKNNIVTYPYMRWGTRHMGAPPHQGEI